MGVVEAHVEEGADKLRRVLLNDVVLLVGRRSRSRVAAVRRAQHEVGVHGVGCADAGLLDSLRDRTAAEVLQVRVRPPRLQEKTPVDALSAPRYGPLKPGPKQFSRL